MKNLVIENKLINYIKNNTESNDLYFYPITKLKNNINVIAYNLDKIYKDNKIELLEKVLNKLSIEIVNTFCMDNKEYFEKENINELLYEKNEYGYCFPKTVETFYFNSLNEWIIYVSHEGTITFIGKDITEIAKEIIPNKYLI